MTNNHAKQSSSWQNPSQMLETFEDMTSALHHADIFVSYEISTVSDDLLLMISDGLYKYIAGPRILADDERIHRLIDEAGNEPHINVICCGTFDQLEVLKDGQLNASVQMLCAPVSLVNLKQSVRSIHNLQQLAVLAEEERKQVAESSEEVKYVLSISRELNGVRDIPRLLNLILKKAREVTYADAGSIYTVNKDTDSLHFKFTQNDSIKQNLTEFEIPINDKSVVGNAVIHERTINIPDLHKLSDDREKNPFSIKHDRSWDKRIGYESHSMLTIPMFDISHSVVGVIQLINCKVRKDCQLTSPDSGFASENVRPFGAKAIEYAEVVAQQAGIALENANMQADIEHLFHSFVNASVTAIELRDPTTSGHSHRVAALTTQLAETVNRVDSGPYRELSFNADQMREIEYASLLHDFGKLGVREHVLVKSKKLYPGQYELIEERFKHIRTTIELQHLSQMNALLMTPENLPPGFTPETLAYEKEQKLRLLDEYYEFICKANEPTVLEQGGFELLRDIANCTYTNSTGETNPYIRENELKALSVSRGSLTAEEFAEIQSHVAHTYEFLRAIPWGRKLANVPQIAAKHHEKLDGSGYPTGAASNDIPVQSRMMTIADIFDALTASDRPYKRAVPVEKALDIINMEVKAEKVDRVLFEIFVESKAYNVVSQKS